MMEQLLISNARYLLLPTSFGIKKIMRNMLALQQSIKTLTNDQEDTNFERAKQYYSLFFIAPQVCCELPHKLRPLIFHIFQDMLQAIRQQSIFTLDEYLSMLKLQCGVNSAEGDAGVTRATDRNYSMYVIDLHGMELDNVN
jgi:exocyst complex component 4